MRRRLTLLLSWGRRLWQIVKLWQQLDLQAYAGAIAFFALLCLTPLWFVGLEAARWSFGTDGAIRLLAMPWERVLGQPAVQSMAEMIRDAPAGRHRTALLFGLSTLGMGLYGTYSCLKAACSIIWQQRPQARRGFFGQLRRQLLAVGALLGLGALFVGSLLASAALAALAPDLFPKSPGAGSLAALPQGLLVWALLTGPCALLLRTLPDVHLAWREVGRAAALIALLLTLGQAAVGVYLRLDDISGVYGTAGTFVTLLIWLYYAAQAVLIGAVVVGSKAGKVAAHSGKAH